MAKNSSTSKRASYIRKIWNKLQDLEKKLNEFEANNKNEHEELRNLINGIGQTKDGKEK